MGSGKTCKTVSWHLDLFLSNHAKAELRRVKKRERRHTPSTIQLIFYLTNDSEKACRYLKSGLKRETVSLLQRLGYTKEVAEKVTDENADLLDALALAVKIEPNANLFTEETVFKIKTNNRNLGDKVTPENVAKLMEIGFSDTDSIRTLKVYVNKHIRLSH